MADEHRGSLLAQALDGRDSSDEQQHLFLGDGDCLGSSSTRTLASSALSSGGGSPTTSSASIADDLLGHIPRHSDFTIPMSNLYRPEKEVPEQLSDPAAEPKRRSVLGNRVQQKYHRYSEAATTTTTMTMAKPPQPQHHFTVENPSSLYLMRRDSDGPTTDQYDWMDQNHSQDNHLEPQPRTLSDLTPPASPFHSTDDVLLSPLSPFSPLTMQQRKRPTQDDGTNSTDTPQHTNDDATATTTHAQSFLLGLAFLAVWSPQNIMAPNLTEMADSFGFTSNVERDFYLGSNLALATAVLSLPIAGALGIWADVVEHRKRLFCATVAMGGVFAYCTGAARSYRVLFLCRLLNGGCMSGSVPIAFSLLGDLFEARERNAASSGLTAMMGLGILAGQVYAGVVGSTLGWPHAFYVSAVWTLVTALVVLCVVQEPVRGGKERVLQDLLRQGARYERKLTWEGFVHTMRHNVSNGILVWQGFFSSVPWGIIFVFLNDYLSQERGFSVPDATYLVFVFGIGCAAGGILGGYWGQLFQARNRSYLPLFMASTTFLGIFPFVGLLNGSFTNAHGYKAVGYSFLGGFIASLPSVSVRPCIINVNPPESRGAALTAANLVINLARGAGPSCITLMGAIWRVDRQFSFNVTLAFFWVITSILLLYLAKYLPLDQDAMEAELAQYAASAMELAQNRAAMATPRNDSESIVSIEDRMTSFDVDAARQSLQFMGDAIREIEHEFLSRGPFRRRRPLMTGVCAHPTSDDEEEDSDLDEAQQQVDMELRRQLWIQQQTRQREEGEHHMHTTNETNSPQGAMEDRQIPSETTSLLRAS